MTGISHLTEAYDRLLREFGPQHWWPGESRFEIVVGAILTQNTSWKNVEQALDNLRDADALQPSSMYELHADELAELIRPSGYYRLKSKRLKNLLELLFRHHDGSLDRLFQLGQEELREQLLSVNGIGPETADSIILYAAESPVFVVDAYTARVAKRHGWIDFDADYYQIQELFHIELPRDARMFNEYHALIVQVGKRFCGKQPKCDKCPLRELLLDGRPLEPW